MSETESVIRKYDPEECERRRLACIETDVVPKVEAFVRKAAHASPPVHIRSAVLFVAQYWNDEADDAVHGRLVYSMNDEPDTDRYFEALERYEQEDDDDMDTYYAWETFIEGPAAGWSGGEPWEATYPNWDDNGEAIPLFAAFCKEGCHQEMGTHEAYTPIASFRHDAAGGGIQTSFFGKMLRPWLDGVRPEWEAEREAPPPPDPGDDAEAQTKSLLESLLDKWR